MLITLLPQGLALDASGVVREDTFASQELATPKLKRGTPSIHLGQPDPDAFEKLRRGIPSTHLGQPDAASEFEKDLPKGFPFSKEGDPEPLEALARFQAARSGTDVLETFGELFSSLDANPSEYNFPYEALRDAAEQLKAEKQQGVRKKLLGIASSLAAQRRAVKGNLSKVVIFGAGPVGLRLAIALRLGGHSVVVQDKRSADKVNSRVNRVWTWDFVKEDLKKLSFAVLLPSDATKEMHAAKKTIEIGNLQALLLKNALLAGVRISFGLDFKSAELASGAVGTSGNYWHFWHTGIGGDSPKGEFRSPFRYDVIVAADGANSKVRNTPAVAKLLKTKTITFPNVFGVVANLKVPKVWNRVDAFDAAKQFQPRLFKDIEEASGLRLENFVFYPGGTRKAGNNYVVMAVDLLSLQNFGLTHFIDGHCEPDPECKYEQKAFLQDRVLDALEVVGEFLTSTRNKGVQQLFDPTDMKKILPNFSGWQKRNNKDWPEWERDTIYIDDSGQDLSVFPFNVRNEAQEMFAVASGAVVALVGDAALTPFWPEGLGIARGFLTAFDACWGIDNRAVPGTQQVVNTLFGLAKGLNEKSAGSILRPNAADYTIDPATRYPMGTAIVKKGLGSVGIKGLTASLGGGEVTGAHILAALIFVILGVSCYCFRARSGAEMPGAANAVINESS